MYKIVYIVEYKYVVKRQGRFDKLQNNLRLYKLILAAIGYMNA